MPQRIVTFVSAIGIWGLLLLCTPNAYAIRLSFTFSESNLDMCELSADDTPEFFNHFGILNFPVSPFGQLPDSQISSSPVRKGKVIPAYRRHFSFGRSLSYPLIGISPKSDTHLQGRNSSVDYYIYTLRRIII